MVKLSLNWCRRGRGNGGKDEGNGEYVENASQAKGNKPEEPQIKRLEELENFYQVDWSKEGFLGRGHFAEVYRGTNIRNGLRVAVKRISRKNQDVKTLRQEIAALLKVNGHDNIVRLYDVFIDYDLVVLVMELLEGGELFSRIVNAGAYSEKEASQHFRKITEALHFMHSHGIVHRDLKPENLVLMTPDPASDIKISDFGLSKVLGEDQTMMFTVCGTSAYAAPEVGLSSSYGPKVDTWSLGVILFVVLAAYHPFDPFGRLDDIGLRQAVCSYCWDFKDKTWNSMSPEVKDLISKLLCPPEKRLDAFQILQHPWIKKYEGLPEHKLNYSAARSLRNFVSLPEGEFVVPSQQEQQQQQQQQQQGDGYQDVYYAQQGSHAQKNDVQYEQQQQQQAYYQQQQQQPSYDQYQQVSQQAHVQHGIYSQQHGQQEQQYQGQYHVDQMQYEQAQHLQFNAQPGLQAQPSANDFMIDDIDIEPIPFDGSSSTTTTSHVAHH